MDDDDEVKKPGLLSKAFKKATSYVFSWHFVAHATLMVGMALSPIGAAAAAAGKTATVTDLGVGLFDSIRVMFNGLVENLDVLGDAVESAADGDFGSSYEIGMMDEMHGGDAGMTHGAAEAHVETAHTTHTPPTEHVSAEHASGDLSKAHHDACTPEQLGEIDANLSAEEAEKLRSNGEIYNRNYVESLQGLCHADPN